MTANPVVDGAAAKNGKEPGAIGAPTRVTTTLTSDPVGNGVWKVIVAVLTVAIPVTVPQLSVLATERVPDPVSIGAIPVETICDV